VNRVVGGYSIASGLMFFLTITYLFAVLGPAGLTFDMFDDATLLLPWVADHSGAYRGMWMLYFISQACLLPVVWMSHRWVETVLGSNVIRAQVASAFGVLSVALAMVGLIVIYATAPGLAKAYVSTDGPRATVLLMHDLAADTGKELRLFSELLLGLWFLMTAWAINSKGVLGIVRWLLAVIGVFTFVVATVKIIDPLSPVEDTLAFVIAVALIAFGVMIWRSVSGTTSTEDVA
jgi:hypothetical protein